MKRRPCQDCGGPKPAGRGERYCETCRAKRHVPTVPPDEQAAMVRAYARIGTTLDQVAAEFYVSPNTVSRVLEANGVSVRPRGGYGASRRRLTVDEELTRAQLYGEGLSLGRIGQLIGRSPSSIHATLHRLGVQMRPTGINTGPPQRHHVVRGAAGRFAPADGTALAASRARAAKPRSVPPRAAQPSSGASS